MPMPEYTYKDEHGHVVTMTHKMLYNGPVHCTLCGGEMWKVPQIVAVTWGGLPPSQANLHPNIADRVRNEDRYRDEFRQKKEQRDED